MTWFVLRTFYGKELNIVSEIHNLGEGYRGFCPIYQSRVVNRGNSRYERRPVWATYVLADWPRDNGKSWHLIRNINGVLEIIGGEFPVVVKEQEIEFILREMTDFGTVTSIETLIADIKRGYSRGDLVRIEGGPFDGRTGVCSWYDKSGVSIKTALLGREVSVYVDLAYAAVSREWDGVAPRTIQRRLRSIARNSMIT